MINKIQVSSQNANVNFVTQFLKITHQNIHNTPVHEPKPPTHYNLAPTTNTVQPEAPEAF